MEMSPLEFGQVFTQLNTNVLSWARSFLEYVWYGMQWPETPEE